MNAQDLIKHLALQPHPEGGWYRQTWAAEGEGRPAGTCIYFLLKQGERSHWHRVDAAEIWHFYTGTPLILSVSETDTGPARDLVLGPDFAAGQTPQIVVPKGWWQAASAPDGWALVGCTVSPGFQSDGFELAEPGFDIPREITTKEMFKSLF
ncbi:cupin domain-containing protein [Litoreibacter sp.]|nr:cupin domain-containing protein [Litoreibacter sp.]